MVLIGDIKFKAYFGVLHPLLQFIFGAFRLEGAASCCTLGLETICDFQFKRTENHYKLPIRASMWNFFTPWYFCKSDRMAAILVLGSSETVESQRTRNESYCNILYTRLSSRMWLDHMYGISARKRHCWSSPKRNIISGNNSQVSNA